MAASGDEYFTKAEKKASAFFFKDLDGAYDLYVKAAGVFKAEKNWRRAGEAFMRAGDTAIGLKNQGDACSAYSDCAKAWKRVDMKGAKMALDQAVRLNIEANRLGPAARLLKDWAEALEQDEQHDDALCAYKEAKKYFEAEDQPQAAVGCLTKMAGIYVNTDRFLEAAKAYETLGNKAADGPTKFQAKDHFFRSLLCSIATITPENSMESSAAAREALDLYTVTDPHFRNTRESEACEGLLAALEDADEEKFDEVIGNLNELRMLDDMKSHCLLRAKRSLSDTR